MSEGTGQEDYDWKKDKYMVFYSLLLLLQFVASAYYYNSMGSITAVYLGWLTIIGSILLATMGWQQLKKEGRELEGASPLMSTELVDTGIYSVVRHPQYLGFLMVVPALMLLSQHWLSVVLGVPGSLLFYMDVRKADRMLSEKFGEDYRKYMEDVPGLNLIAGVLRLLSARAERHPFPLDVRSRGAHRGCPKEVHVYDPHGAYLRHAVEGAEPIRVRGEQALHHHRVGSA